MCDHKNFKANVNVTRLYKDGEPETIIGYTTDITIHCAECLKPFQWIGVLGESSPDQPMVSADELTLRAPIKPVI